MKLNFFSTPSFQIEKWEYIYAFVSIGYTKGVLYIYEVLTFLKDKFKTFKGHDFSKIEIYFFRSQNRTDLMEKYNKESDLKKSFFICK